MPDHQRDPSPDSVEIGSRGSWRRPDSGTRQRTAKGMCAAWLVAVMAWALGAPAPAFALEQGINRPGGDFHGFDLPQPWPEKCRNACNADPRCKSWTYVKPGVQSQSAKCWLKGTIPQPVRDPNCVSGVKGEGSEQTVMPGPSTTTCVWAKREGGWFGQGDQYAGAVWDCLCNGRPAPNSDMCGRRR